MISSVSSFALTSVVVSKLEDFGPKMFLQIPASAAAVFNSNAMKTILAKVISTLFANGNSILSNSPRNLQQNPSPDWVILKIYIFDNFISAEKLLLKRLHVFAMCVLVRKNLWGNSVWPLPIIMIMSKLLKF